MGDSHNEAEDIVADAIKLNSDDLNEKETVKSLETEDEPNYEVDDEEEIDEQAELRNEHDLEDEIEETNCEEEPQKDESSQVVEQNETVEVGSQKIEEASESKKNGDESGDKSASGDGKTKKSDNGEKGGQSEAKSGHNKGDLKDEHAAKDGKKEASASETDSKAAAKSKSSSSTTKEKEKEKSSEQQKSSNEKTLWVSGLTSSARASDLQSLFKKYGKVVAAKIIKNAKGGSKYFGLITMASVEDAEKCIQHLHKTEFDGRTITVEKSKLVEEKKDRETNGSDKKERAGRDTEKSSSKRDRSTSRTKSPKRRASSRSPIRRFPLPGHRPNYPPRRGPPPFHGGFRGGFVSRPPPFAPPPFVAHGPPVRDFDSIRRREIRLEEHRRAEDYRRQRDLERRQQDERDKLEREKLKLKIERERLEREKADFLRAEREKARIERERIEREREELRRKQAQLPTSSSRGLDDSRSKRYDDPYSSSSWDKPRFASNSTGLTGSGSDLRKLEQRDRSSRERGSSHHRREDDWKNSVAERSRFLGSKSTLAPPTQSAYLSSAARATGGYERGAPTDSWASAPDRIPPASSLNKFAPFAQVQSSMADRVRPAPSLAPPTMMSSSIGLYQPSNPMGGLVSNPPVYGNSNLNYRRY